MFVWKKRQIAGNIKQMEKCYRTLSVWNRERMDNTCTKMDGNWENENRL